MYISTDVVKL